MHNKSKSHHPPPPPKLETYSKYINFIDFHKRNANILNYQKQPQPHISTSHLDKINPLNHNSRAIISERKQKEKVSLHLTKKDIKQKIKDRVKAEIQNLIQRNTYKVNKVQFRNRQAKEIQPGENVSIIGSSVPRLVGYSPQVNGKIQRRQNIKQNRMTKSQLFAQIIQRSRKVRSSLGARLQKQRPQLRFYKDKNQKIDLMCRRSMSTDIRIKNMSKKKPIQLQKPKKGDKNKQETIQPWIIANFAEDQQIF